MAMGANQKFDFNQADQLKNKLKQEQSRIESALNNTMKQVEGVKQWWSGGSEEAFIQNFKTTKDKIVKSLGDCIEGYNKLVDQIKQAKQQSDEDIARQLRG